MASLYLPPGYDFDAQHDGTEHLAINNTWLRRFLTRLALHTAAKFYSRDGLCIPISKHKIVKTGIRTHLTEGATLKYLEENTSIPVPKVFCSFLHKNRAYIVMERIQGDELPTALNVLSPEALEGLFLQLRKFIQELRALKPPTTGVESCVGGSLFDSRIPRGNPRFGPFTTIQNFHFWLRDDLKPEDLQDQKRDQDWHDLQKMMDRQDGPCPPPVFTHGDLNPFNILVREGKVVGIIDWEFSGWYPHYWEYTSAWFGNITRLEWQSKLDKFLDRPPLEDFEMEKVRNKWWGEC
ncbi:hypothetical protein HYQ46_007801 [Verticillium longisporum]|uniref:Aminoglycoside phosphotransferase domain-containing protein n=1 Tax=Verticillium longisporum TaxID=100787 RepID=A0A0G4LFP4_VERLO|nr:hypothetical protein HYQ44_005685 [Verticillium longisporum]KAG7141687.1 hypothetical protein HYQ46_007801 [Verticillium longisporum]CRK20821.1 hypothetical protein BN1708_012952 [Verticillium longisporum]